jgi:hypothetical protein
MTQDVIDLVHAMADQDNMPTALKITTKAGIVLHDTASIAGVYDHSEINEEEDEEEVDGFDDEMNPNDIGEILPDKKNTPELTVLENDDYEEASITNDNNNSHDSDDKVRRIMSLKAVQTKTAVMRKKIKAIKEILPLLKLQDLEEYPNPL